MTMEGVVTVALNDDVMRVPARIHEAARAVAGASWKRVRADGRVDRSRRAGYIGTAVVAVRARARHDAARENAMYVLRGRRIGRIGLAILGLATAACKGGGGGGDGFNGVGDIAVTSTRCPSGRSSRERR